MSKTSFTSVLFIAALLAIFSSPSFAFEKVNKSYFGEVALDGYDAVSYFSAGEAVKGNKKFSVKWEAATWLFSTEVNRQKFISSPKTFAPQYGGYCSNQMSLGNLSDIDGEVWRIIDNKLYLFGHDAGRVRWKSETPQRIANANQHWRLYLSN
ncbi:MAG: hypothetical protein ACI845_002381 [Gammaproteobacteria bacterium]|jgi:hypothetical protein